MSRLLSVSVACVFAVLLSASPAAAQYFGQNKVQYKQLDFQVLKTEHFDIYFYPEERKGIDIAAQLAERWHARLERFFDHTLRGRQPLVLYASHTDFEQNNIVPEATGEGTGGVTEPIRRRIVLPFGGPLRDTDHVIGHELVHAFQFDITAPNPGSAGPVGAERLPLWFIEGMAEYLTLGPVDGNTAMWMRDAARKEELPAIHDLDNPKYFPYRWGQAFWAYVGGRFGDEVIPRMLALGGSVSTTDALFHQVLGVGEKELSADWQAAIRRTYAPTLETATAPDRLGRTVIGENGKIGDLNVGPALSPDGRKIAFLSERGLLSIDLYVADAQTGRVLHKLTSQANDPHYSSLQFIYSAGAWDSTSTKLAVATVTGGRPALAIFDAESGRRTTEIRIPDVDEVLNPTWAPDGSAIAFTGMTAGLTDLYVWDIGVGGLRRLTNDAFAELQPSWSPDGRRIAFVTDRFSSRLDTFTNGDYRIALANAGGGGIQDLGALTGGDNINPQWGTGNTLYFLADPDGVQNLYRVTLGDGGRAGAVQRLTDVSTGLSGITASSPALSVATRSNTAAFSVYDDGKYAIHTLDVSGGAAATAPRGDRNGAMLPPVDRRGGGVAAMLADARFGLPSPQNYEVEDYRPRLALEGVGQPTVAIGANQFGAAIGGGIALQFSDMLNNHLLATAFQFNSSISGNLSAKDLAVQAAYLNQTHRWNWGLAGGQVPYLSGGFESGFDVSNGQVVGVDRAIVFRQTERSAQGILAYPFSRAKRVEFQGGVTQYSFDQIVQTTVYDPSTGFVLSDDRGEATSLGPNLTLATTTAAFVSDTSSFGATSPVAGERFRLEVTPTFGSVNYAGVLADYRRYFMPAPFYTIAGRVMHYGRYGSGGEDQRLFPLYLGYPGLVRGYDVNSFDNTDCVATTVSDCPVVDRLVGSRMLIGNLEFRFPLLRPFGVSPGMYGPVPVEVAFFADGGVTWDQRDTLSVNRRLREGVASSGVAFRVNLFGFAIAQFDVVHPFQRPGRGWVYQFNLAPGF